MSGLSKSEKRGLRRIERELRRDDPRLARLLSDATGSRKPAFSRSSPAARSVPPPLATMVFVSSGFGLIFGGLLIGNVGMALGGMMMLLSLPVIALLVIFGNRPG